MNTSHMVFLVIAAAGLALLVMSGLSLFGHRLHPAEEDDGPLEEHEALPRVRTDQEIYALQRARAQHTTPEQRHQRRPDRGDRP